jgi:hypothetical protein
MTGLADVASPSDRTGAGVFAGEGQRARVPTGARFPDFFIVGHAKSGTTALYEMLKAHPQIFLPQRKEPQFFAKRAEAGGAHTGAEHTGAERTGVGAQPPASRFDQTGRRAETVQDYLALFAPARHDQLVGEGSTFYLWSRIAPGRIAEVAPDARIIAILREPASFLRSLHMQMVQNRAETELDLRAAIALEPARRQGRKIPRDAHWPEALMYTQRVRYVEQLRRYEALFGREQMLVLIYDDFRADNAGTVARVLRFLDVDDTVALAPVEANPSVRVRSPALDRAVRAVYQGIGPAGRSARAATMLVPQPVRGAALRAVRRHAVYAKPQPADDRLMRELRRRFLPEVVAAGEYLDRDLVGLWGYDQLG